MLDVCYGRSERGRYDASACRWNRFLADFSADSDTRAYSPRLRTAAALRAQVRASRVEKVYSRRLPDENRELLSQYLEENNEARRKK